MPWALNEPAIQWLPGKSEDQPPPFSPMAGFDFHILLMASGTICLINRRKKDLESMWPKQTSKNHFGQVIFSISVANADYFYSPSQ